MADNNKTGVASGKINGTKKPSSSSSSSSSTKSNPTLLGGVISAIFGKKK